MSRRRSTPDHDHDDLHAQPGQPVGAQSPVGEEQDELPRERALEELIRLLTLEKDQINEQLLRTMADLQNFRKRVEQEKQQLRQFATEQLVYDLLPVLDNFERTLMAIHKGATVESVHDGINAVERQLRSVLETRNVSRIAAFGQPFDPSQHEAIGTVETAEHPEGTVIEEVEPGYRMGEKIVRPVRVRVARRP